MKFNYKKSFLSLIWFFTVGSLIFNRVILHAHDSDYIINFLQLIAALPIFFQSSDLFEILFGKKVDTIVTSVRKTKSLSRMPFFTAGIRYFFVVRIIRSGNEAIVSKTYFKQIPQELDSIRCYVGVFSGKLRSIDSNIIFFKTGMIVFFTLLIKAFNYLPSYFPISVSS